MAFQDDKCNCTEYCQCGFYDPCGCEGMNRDPHCLTCCQHLSEEDEARWRLENPGNWEQRWEDPNDK